MSLTAIAWVCLFIALLGLSLYRASWAVALYMLCFFVIPSEWWWGRSGMLAGPRWNLIAGCILLAVVVLHAIFSSRRETYIFAREHVIAALLVANATIIHFLVADDVVVSEGAYILLAKFVLLFFLITLAVRDERDLDIVCLSLLLGAAYIGFEVTVNGRGSLDGNRLEGVGAPGATGANQLASLMVTCLPLLGALLYRKGKSGFVLVALAGPLILNVVLFCNSRGGFLALLVVGPVLLVLSRGQVRRRVLLVLALGGVALLFLLGDPRITDRFLTIFDGAGTRDPSAAGRLVLWDAGVEVIADHPLGSGGDAFNVVYGPEYLARRGVAVEERAVHNGYLNEACNWGVQGLLLRGLLILFAVGGTLAVVRRRPADGEADAFFGLCLISAMAAFCVSSLFGDHLDAEWGLWLVALMVAYRQIHSAPPIEEVPSKSEAPPRLAGARIEW